MSISGRPYPAIIERAGKGYSVYFPDLPGCTSAGDTVVEAAQHAQAALEGHLFVSAEHGDVAPEPSELGDIPLAENEVTRILVRQFDENPEWTREGFERASKASGAPSPKR